MLSLVFKGKLYCDRANLDEWVGFVALTNKDFMEEKHVSKASAEEIPLNFLWGKGKINTLSCEEAAVMFHRHQNLKIPAARNC